MKKFFASVFVFFSLVAVVYSTNSVAQTTYPLHCQGGGAMTILYSSDRPNDITALYVFKRTAPSSGPRPRLAAGECTWLDREVNSQEPVTLKLNLNRLYPSPAIWKIFQFYNVGLKKMQPRIILDGVLRPRRDVLIELADPAMGLQFNVFNNGTELEARSIRY